jgi:hypothetical protein
MGVGGGGRVRLGRAAGACRWPPPRIFAQTPDWGGPREKAPRRPPPPKPQCPLEAPPTCNPNPTNAPHPPPPKVVERVTLKRLCPTVASLLAAFPKVLELQEPTFKELVVVYRCVCMGAGRLAPRARHGACCSCFVRVTVVVCATFVGPCSLGLSCAAPFRRLDRACALRSHPPPPPATHAAKHNTPPHRRRQARLPAPQGPVRGVCRPRPQQGGAHAGHPQPQEHLRQGLGGGWEGGAAGRGWSPFGGGGWEGGAGGGAGARGLVRAARRVMGPRPQEHQQDQAAPPHRAPKMESRNAGRHQPFTEPTLGDPAPDPGPRQRRVAAPRCLGRPPWRTWSSFFPARRSS